MKINFKSVAVKNFLSFGNNPTVLNFTDTKTTLVAAKNGSGKTALLIDAPHFALFGKPFRSIKKDCVLNSINKKELFVELVFDVSGVEYSLIRGIKPDVLQLFRDGEDILSGSAREKQAQIESIIGMDSFVFSQVVSVSTDYTPFMRLATGDRRAFVEHVLDLEIFTSMHTLLKARAKDTKGELASVVAEETETRNSIQRHQDAVEILKTVVGDDIDVMKAQLAELVYENDLHIPRMDVLLDRKNKINDLITKLNNNKNLGRAKKASAEKELSLVVDGVCPTCGSTCSVDKIESYKTQIVNINDKLKMIEDKEQEVLAKLTAVVEEYDILTVRRSEGKTAIDALSLSIEKHNPEHEKEIKTREAEIEVLTAKLDEIVKHKEDVTSALSDLSSVNIAFVKDAVKNKIIKEYIPFFNERIQFYLDEMGFNVAFEIDEEFNETIRSRFRDDFTYESFSSGQQSRIDFALLLTFRDVAKKMSSVDTNLLVLDEVFGKSLDQDAVLSMEKLVKNLKDSSSFIISHNDILKGSFQREISFHVDNNFSILTQS